MEQQGLQPNVQTYNSVIDAIARSGENPDRVEAILNCMVKAGVRPDVVTYSAAINGMYGCCFLHPPLTCLLILF